MLNTLQTIQYAFVDESGDPHLDIDKAGVSKFYVVTALLVDDSHREQLIRDVSAVKAAYFGDGEMKSSGLGKNFDRRRSLLSSLTEVGVRYCAVVADKSQIDPNSGLQYRRSFIKYLQGRLYKRLYRSFSSLHILADEHGRTDFMEGFKLYLEARYQKELFDHEDFSFVPSEDHVLIQAADIIGGSLYRLYSERDPPELFDIIAPGAIIIERWPPASDHRDIVAGLPDQERFNHLVAQQGVMLAREFINDNGDNMEPDVEAQLEALRYLLYRYELDPDEYVHAEPILQHVNASREEELSIQSFRTNVIAKLRSDGVIIASSSKGYKIPNTVGDISDFVSLVEGLVLPYIRRLSLARQHLLLSSQGMYDIVPTEKHGKLAACLRSLEDG